MQWREFLQTLGEADRTRLSERLSEGHLYSKMAAGAADRADVEWLLACIDRALDALAAARILLQAPPEPQPWEYQAYRAYRSHHPTSTIRIAPSELERLRAAVREGVAPPEPRRRRGSRTTVAPARR